MSPVDLIWLAAAAILVVNAIAYPWILVGLAAAILVWALSRTTA